MLFKRDPKQLFWHDYLLKYTIVPLVPACVTPNALTIFRFLSTPFVIYFLLYEHYSVGVILFLIVSFSDALDGSLARLRSQITEWGTLYDPIADKLLISSLILFIVIKYINPIFSIIIIFLEVLIVVGAYRHKLRGGIVSANIFGKTKMCLQVAGVFILLLAVWSGFDLFIPVSVGTLSLAILFAVISLFTYGF
ncbi:CDP-alcohol phosphatidyltransferase family protein [Patescibacteria group bacterium]|nr:CDP-alcohol phosphatidyltransferase family protein [Patescibacteria group bacterium]MBU1705449.1 CDP-alcohol phosphatidyltransferase family protein [Patescibacteria group bacterium]